MNQKSFESRIIKQALKESKLVREESDFERYRLGACIFTNKKILVSGCNTLKANTLQKKYNHYRGFETRGSCCHAEINSLLKLKRRFPDIRPKDVSIFVYREDSYGKYAIAKPCPACEQALRDFGITDVYYTGLNSLCYEKYK